VIGIIGLISDFAFKWRISGCFPWNASRAIDEQLVIEAVSRTYPAFARRAHGSAQAMSSRVPITISSRSWGPRDAAIDAAFAIVAGLDQRPPGACCWTECPSSRRADRGMVFQTYNAVSVAHRPPNICFGLREKGMSPARQDEIAAHYVAEVGSPASSTIIRMVRRHAATDGDRARTRQRAEDPAARRSRSARSTTRRAA